MSDFHLQGAVPLNSEVYVERVFESSIVQNVYAGHWVVLLGPRQHGKTSGLLRVKKRLTDDGLRCAFVDMQGLPPVERFEDVLGWITKRVSQSLGRGEPSRPNDVDSKELRAWLELALPEGVDPIVLFIDEASAIKNDDWRNSFYGQIRALANERADTRDGDIARRLRFVFAGSFRPETIVRNNLNSPFNVSERIETEDLSLDQARMLRKQVHVNIEDDCTERAYALVGGQPFLLQFIFSRLSQVDLSDWPEAFERALTSLKNGENDHFEHLFSRILAEKALSSVVATMVRDGGVQNQPADPNYRFLPVLGIAKREGDRLVFRNEIYRLFAQSSPQLTAENPPSASPMVLVVPPEDAYVFMKQDKLREIALSAEVGAVRSHNAGSYRLALTGFGCALEALLLDWLLSLSPSTLSSVVSAALGAREHRANFQHRERQNDPSTWRLVNLIRVARHINRSVKVIEPSDALREYRNLVHPSVALSSYLPENQLQPESLVASGFLSGLRRDIATVI